MSKLPREKVLWIQFQLEINIQVNSYSYIWRKNLHFQYKLLNDVLYLNKKLFHFGVISQLWIIWWNTTASFLWMHLYATFMEPSPIIYFRKNCITSFNFTESHLSLYSCFRSELYYSKSFASNFQIKCV